MYQAELLAGEQILRGPRWKLSCDSLPLRISVSRLSPIETPSNKNLQIRPIGDTNSWKSSVCWA